MVRSRSFPARSLLPNSSLTDYYRLGVSSRPVDPPAGAIQDRHPHINNIAAQCPLEQQSVYPEGDHPGQIYVHLGQSRIRGSTETEKGNYSHISAFGPPSISGSNLICRPITINPLIPGWSDGLILETRDPARVSPAFLRDGQRLGCILPSHTTTLFDSRRYFECDSLPAGPTPPGAGTLRDNTALFALSNEHAIHPYMQCSGLGVANRSPLRS